MKHKILFNLKTPLVELKNSSKSWDLLEQLSKVCGYDGIMDYTDKRNWTGTVKDALLDLSEQLKELKS